MTSWTDMSLFDRPQLTFNPRRNRHWLNVANTCQNFLIDVDSQLTDLPTFPGALRITLTLLTRCYQHWQSSVIRCSLILPVTILRVQKFDYHGLVLTFGLWIFSIHNHEMHELHYFSKIISFECDWPSQCRDVIFFGQNYPLYRYVLCRR